MKVALTGPVQLELLAPYFGEAGYDLAGPGEIPDVTYDVTAHDRELEKEVPGFYDERLGKLAGCPYSIDGIKAIADEFAWEYERCRQACSPKKVLAVDADNTLWHGILSEDGPEALEPCTVFQDGLRKLAADGVVLVMLSKNDPGSIGLDWFAVKKVNWEPKPGNLVEACRELNLGLDSVVFVDDNPHERAQMKAHLPEVSVAPWNGWREKDSGGREERQLVRRLREYFFSGAGTTEEDRLRAADYIRLVGLAVQSGKYTSKEDYLADLGLWVEARPAEERDLDRLAQMAGKTNQFNATTIRRTRENFAARIESVFVFRAGDRYGEQGIVCYAVVDPVSGRITDFVMSCRAMGRTLEHFAYGWIASRLGYRPAVDFIPTNRNAPVRAFLDSIAAGDELKTYYRKIE